VSDLEDEVRVLKAQINNMEKRSRKISAMETVMSSEKLSANDIGPTMRSIVKEMDDELEHSVGSKRQKVDENKENLVEKLIRRSSCFFGFKQPMQ